MTGRLGGAVVVLLCEDIKAVLRRLGGGGVSGPDESVRDEWGL